MKTAYICDLHPTGWWPCWILSRWRHRTNLTSKH